MTSYAPFPQPRTLMYGKMHSLILFQSQMKHAESLSCSHPYPHPHPQSQIKHAESLSTLSTAALEVDLVPPTLHPPVPPPSCGDLA